jgi:hypothetical protein
VKDDAPEEPGTSQAARNYTLLCLGSLLVVLLALLSYDLPGPLWALLPLLIGTTAVVAHWSAGPPLLVGSVVVVLATNSGGYPPLWPRFTPHQRLRQLWRDVLKEHPSSRLDNQPGPLPPDLALCAALLAYTVGHYRLLALTANVFPVDPRRRELIADRGKGPVRLSSTRVAQRRSPGSVDAGELGGVVVGAAVCTALASLLWFGYARDSDLWEVPVPEDLVLDPPVTLGLPVPLEQLLFLTWAAGLAVVITAAVRGYLRQAASGPEANRLYLQDLLWRETRREQSRLNRWLVWARLGGQRRKEKS